jgi:hypothetical protein
VDAAVNYFLFITNKAKLRLGSYATFRNQVVILYGCNMPVPSKPKVDDNFKIIKVMFLENTMYREAVVQAEEEGEELSLV